MLDVAVVGLRCGKAVWRCLARLR